MKSEFGKKMSAGLLGLLLFNGVLDAGEPDLTLWYDKPASSWQKEALPIGNGRLGAMLFGGVERERIQFNEESLWVGDEESTGAYQAFGDVFVEMPHGAVTNYRRELDLRRAVHVVTYESGGLTYRREAFASAPAGVLVFRFTADQPGSLSGSIALADAHKGQISASGKRLQSTGSLAGCQVQQGSALRDRPELRGATAGAARRRHDRSGGRPHSI